MRYPTLAFLLLLFGVFAYTGSRGWTGRPAVARSAATGVHVDSILSREEQLRRFVADLPERPGALAGGRASLDQLAREVLGAAAQGDIATLRALHLSRAEFAYLYYASSPLSQPPYDLSPGLMWFQLEGNSARGLSRLQRHLAGRMAEFVGIDCSEPQRQGENRVYSRCTVRYRTPQEGLQTEPLFASLIERDGHFKVLSYANRL